MRGITVEGCWERSYSMRGLFDTARTGLGTAFLSSGNGVVWYGDPNPRGGGVSGPGVEGSVEEENVGDGASRDSSKWTCLTCLPGIVGVFVFGT